MKSLREWLREGEREQVKGRVKNESSMGYSLERWRLC